MSSTPGTGGGEPAGARIRRHAVGFYRVLRANPLSFIGFVLVFLILVVALIVTVAPHVLVPYGPTQETGVYNSPPSWAHPFGTDGNSFDIYSNVMLALPLDVSIGVAVAGFSLILGGLLGLVAGYWDRPGTLGGVSSSAILRITDVFLAFPSLVLALAFVASLGPGLTEVILAIMLTWWPYYVRLVRGEVLAVKHLPYITAARAAGVRDGRIVIRHVLRNVLEPVVVYFTLDIGTVLVTFSTIAYVIPGGLPYPSSRPEWGAMLSYYQGSYLIGTYWWAITFPSIAIFVTVLSFSLLGDGLRDVLDPRTRRALAQSAITHEPPPESPVDKAGVAEPERVPSLPVSPSIEAGGPP